jgi:mannose-6-phosphate isomerase
MTPILTNRFVEKPWGRDVLPKPFLAPPGRKIGEIWFEPPKELPQLLVKYLFTSERLSVQVHPSDDQAEAAGLGRKGKEECWLVIDAEPGAVLGIGFREEIDTDAMRAAALDGSIEDLLEWHPVSAGDFFYIPAGTVHAIGAGVSLIEIQQNSDITYRLYDYGRPRELHLEAGIGVAKGAPHVPSLHRKLKSGGNVRLVDGPHFRLARIDGMPGDLIMARYKGPMLVIPLNRSTLFVGGALVAAGECALAESLDLVEFNPSGQCLLAQPVLSGA